jgi:hypothetical protein
MDYRPDEIVERLALNSDLTFEALDGVVPGRQCSPHGSRQPGIERIWLLFAGIDDDGGR